MNHMLTPRMNLGVGAIKDMRDAVTGVTFNAIYAIGGYSGKAILGTAEKYEIQTDTWTEIAPMKTPRRNVGMWGVLGCLWATWLVDIATVLTCGVISFYSRCTH